MDYFGSKGMNVIRLPFRWERLQQSANASFNTTEFNRLNAFVSAATAKDVSVILDPHNFARYYPDPGNYQSSSQGLVGSDVPNSVFGNFWFRVADVYRTNGRVIFNLVNEPNTMPTEQWVSAANAAIAAIRAAGATNLILVPGNAWTGAWTWNQNWYGTPNAQAMLNIVDPGNNYAYDVHQYLDSNGSGGSTNIVSPTIGAERLAGFTQWLRNNNRKGFLGEFAEFCSGRGEVERTIDRIVWYAGWADKLPQVLGGSNPVAGPYFNFTVPEPTGVVAVLAPDEPALLGLVTRVLLGFAECAKFFSSGKCEVTGTPIRRTLMERIAKAQALAVRLTSSDSKTIAPSSASSLPIDSIASRSAAAKSLIPKD